MTKNKPYKSTFFKNEKLPFIEARFVKDSPYHYKEHFHETLSIGVVEVGTISYRNKGGDYLLRQNELAVINPFVMHSCNPAQKELRTYHMIYIDTAYCKAVQETLFGQLDSYIDVNIVNIENKELYQKYLDLNYNLFDNEILYLEKEQLLQEFLIELFTLYCDKEISSNLKNSNITKAIEYMDENYKENLTVQEISDYIGISQFYFIKLFKQEMNLTPHIYLLNKKISQSKKLISEGMEISSVALEVGLNDQSHLNRLFKQYVAVTPREYKISTIK